MKTILDGQILTLKEKASWLDAVKTRYPNEPRKVLAIRARGVTYELSQPALENVPAMSLTLLTEEGCRIYERSLRFILLLAVRDLHPGARVIIENSSRLGVYVTIQGITLDVQKVNGIKKRMQEIIACDLPYERLEMSCQQAMTYFRERGALDKVHMLSYRPSDEFTLYRAAGMMDYFYGVMVPSSGYTSLFDLHFNLPGLELVLPDPSEPTRLAAFRETPKLKQTFAESTNWARILKCENLADLDDMVRNKKIREFIRINEALHEKSISDVADAFMRSGARLILIAGPSSSGKTTFANRLSIQLRVRGLIPMKLSMDDYYRDRDQLPLEADGKPDLERVDALDVPRLGSDLVRLLQGESVETPLFDFNTQRRKEQTLTMQLTPGQPIIMEGIHALNDQLTQDIPGDKKFLIYISALTTMNLDDHNRIRTTDVRLLRRIIRDSQFRGTPPEQTMDIWDSVRRGEERYIFPYQENADVMFNSTLVYELVVMKKYAYQALKKITQDSPHYTRARRLLKFLNYVQETDVEDEIPVNSILREFLGGCCFYKEEE